MLMFLRPGYLDKHPQPIKSSTNILVFFIFLFVLILPIVMVEAAGCGDGNCEKGYDEVLFVLNVSGEYIEGNFTSNQSSVYTLNETDYLVEIVSIWPKLPEHIKQTIKVLINTFI